VLVAIHRDDTALVYTGPQAVANGQPQAVTAVLSDPQSQAPLAGKTVTLPSARSPPRPRPTPPAPRPPPTAHGAARAIYRRLCPREPRSRIFHQGKFAEALAYEHQSLALRRRRLPAATSFGSW